MPTKYTKSSLLDSLPTDLIEADRGDMTGSPMSEVAAESENLTPDARRKKLLLENSKNPTRIIRKGE